MNLLIIGNYRKQQCETTKFSVSQTNPPVKVELSCLDLRLLEVIFLP